MLSCEQATFLMSQRAERRLRWSEGLKVALHVLMCSGCRLFGRQAAIINRVARKYAPGRDGPED